MGEAGWKGLVPFYSDWIICQHTWGMDKGWMMLTWLLAAAGPTMMGITHWLLFKGFGKDLLFCVICTICPFIGFAICAFDGSGFYNQEGI